MNKIIFFLFFTQVTLSVIEPTTLIYFNAARTKKNKQVAQAIYSAIYSELDDTGKKNVAGLFKQTFGSEPEVPKPAVVLPTGDTALDKLIAEKKYNDAYIHIIKGVGFDVASQITGDTAQQVTTDMAAKIKGTTR